jgi:pimeloyl-ACP methyl ester carboxylesterase
MSGRARNRFALDPMTPDSRRFLEASRLPRRRAILSVMLRIVPWTLLILAGVAGGLAVLIGYYEPRLIYFPDRDLERTPASVGLRFEEVDLGTADGERIYGWFLPAATTPAPVTILLLHGNGGNISHRLDKLAVLHTLGADVLIVDYRGYGRSSGSPDEKGTYRDADAAYEYLASTRHVDPRRVVVCGESLGAAVAVDLAARRPVGGLVMESAFSSAVDVGQEMFRYLPVRLLARNRYESVAKIGAVQAPILILHSRDDEYFGWQHPQRLYGAAHEPKRLVELRGGHNDAFLVSRQVYTAALSAFLQQVAGAART